jgi:ketosteroid isomerase-like protein
MRQLFGPAPPPNTQRKNKLDWYPIWTDASESGDLALSTGPTVTSELATGKALRWGNFASVWKKQGDGSWKVIVDMGAPHAEPPNPETQWKAGKATGFKAKNINVEQEAQKLAEFEKTAFRGTSAADSYAKVLTVESRLHREGVFPVKGKSLIVDHLSKSGVQNVTFEPQKAEVASSGDIAYTYGAYTLQPGDKKGYYVHFWKREKNGDWKMVLDLANAEEEEKK